MNLIPNQDEVKEEEDEYVEKIRYLGIDMSKNLEHKQKLLWIKTINWYLLADNLKDKIRDYIEKKMKILDIIVILLAGLGLLTNGLQMTFYLKFKKERGPDRSYSIIITGESSNTIEALRFISSGSSLIVIILIMVHYEIKKNYLIFKHEIPFNSSIFSKNLIIPMVVEIILILIHTPPFFNDIKIQLHTTGSNSEKVPIYLDLFISVFILSRVYLLFKFYANYSKWGGVFASRVCNECNAKGGFIFTYKAGIKEYPFLSVIILMVLTILIFGYGLRNSEISFIKNIPERYFQDWTKVTNGFWFMTTNILLLGYGDFYPTTQLGRIIAFISCLWGILLESLLVNAIVNSIKLNQKEELAYNEVERTLEVSVYKKKALNLIFQFYLSHVICDDIQKTQNNSFMKNNLLEGELQIHKKRIFNKNILKAKASLLEFIKMRKNKEKKEREISVQNLMTKINIEINDNMNYLLRNIQTQINTLLENINQAQENQNKILLFSGILDVLHKSMYDKVKERTKSNGQVIDFKEMQSTKNYRLSNKDLIENLDKEREGIEIKKSTKKLNNYK
jgi:hypothetical protein